MKSLIVKLRKGQKEVTWDKLAYFNSTHVEFFATDLESLEAPNDFPTDKIISVQINCPGLKKLPSFLGSLDYVQVLKIRNLSKVDFSKHEYAFENLKTLQLADMNLDHIPSWLADCHDLETLDLQGNNITSIPTFFKNFKNLRRINLDKNNLEYLPDFLKELPKLNHLSVDGNKFSDAEKLRINQVFKITI